MVFLVLARQVPLLNILPDLEGGLRKPFQIPPQRFNIHRSKQPLNTPGCPAQRFEQSNLHQVIDAIDMYTKQQGRLIHR